MRLVTLRYADGYKWGITDPDGKSVRIVSAAGGGNISSVIEFIRYCADVRDCVETAKAAFEGSLDTVPFDPESLAAPIPFPARNIFCVGKNYLNHVREFDRKQGTSIGTPAYPCFFTKATHSVNGPYSAIPAHEGVTSALDYEGELGVVISKRGVDISIGNAMDYVFGYTVINDVTARDLQTNHLQWFKGKSLDGFCPMGPWIVMKDSVADSGNLKIRTSVNGEIRQDSTTSEMMFGIPALISQLSAGLTLEPGDIIATGTPSGVGMSFEPPKFLHKGDRVVVEIENIGHIRNTIA